MEFTHFNEQGLAKMVDVSDKDTSLRTATAQAFISLNQEIIEKIKDGQMKKGNVLAVAQVAGIMAAKKTSDTIPMCHNINLTSANINFEYTTDGILIYSTVKCNAETGVEMEALNSVTVAALTIYDMCKSISKDMVISDIHLVSKTGGKSGNFTFGG